MSVFECPVPTVTSTAQLVSLRLRIIVEERVQRLKEPEEQEV